MRHMKRVSMLRADATDDLTQAFWEHWKDWLYGTDRGWIDIYDFLTGTFEFSGLGGKR